MAFPLQLVILLFQCVRRSQGGVQCRLRVDVTTLALQRVVWTSREKTSSGKQRPIKLLQH